MTGDYPTVLPLACNCLLLKQSLGGSTLVLALPCATTRGSVSAPPFLPHLVDGASCWQVARTFPSWLRSPPYHTIRICNQNRAKPPSVLTDTWVQDKCSFFTRRTRAALTPRASGPCWTSTPDPLARLYRVSPGSHRQPAPLLYNSLISLFPVHPTRTLAHGAMLAS